MEATGSLPRLRLNPIALCDQKNLFPVLGVVRGNDHESSFDLHSIVQLLRHTSANRQEPTLVGDAGLQNGSFRNQYVVQHLVPWEEGSALAGNT